MYKWHIYRNGDSLRIRKTVVELWVGGTIVDRRRMFTFPQRSLSRRLERKKERMKQFARLVGWVV